MSYDTLTMLKAHAIELLGIEVQSYFIDDISGLINNIKTPFAIRNANNLQKNSVILFNA